MRCIVLFLLAWTASCWAAHFELGRTYKYSVHTNAVGDSNITQSVTSVGGIVPDQASIQTNWIFTANFQITPYEENAEGSTNCSLEFINGVPTIEIQAGSDTTAVTGKINFSRWFSFTLSSEGAVTAFFAPPDEAPEAIMFKKGVVNQFSAKIVEPGTGLRKRSFDTEEHDISGPHYATYTVSSNEDPHHVVYRKLSVPIRRDTDDATKVTRVEEKVLIRNEHLGHIVSIEHQDEFSLAGSTYTGQSGMRRRDQDGSSPPSMLLAGRGSTTVTFLSQAPTSVEYAPPAILVSQPLSAPPPPVVFSLDQAILQIDISMGCFDHSIVNSNIALSTGQKAKCFQDARKIITRLRQDDAKRALNYLIERYAPLPNGWVAHELAGEMCVGNADIADSMLNGTIARMARVSPEQGEAMLNEGLKALFKCGVTTDFTISAVSQIVDSQTVRNQTVPSTSRDHAMLTLGHMSRFAGQAGNNPLADQLHNKIRGHLSQDVNATVYANAFVPQAAGNMHVGAFAASAQAAKHSNMLLALGNFQRPAAANLLQNVLLPNASDPAVPITVYQHAAHALGTMEGEAVENALLSAIVNHHPKVSQAARHAHGLKRRSASIEEIVTGLGALQGIVEVQSATDVANTTTGMPADVLRARDFLRFHRRDLTSDSFHFGLAAPSFQFDQKFGPDLVGVNVRAHAMNSISLDLSVIASHLAIDVDNVAGASLYVDIGGLQEMPIFGAALQFEADVGYDMDMLKGFKFSDVANIVSEFNKVKDSMVGDMKFAIQLAKDAWADVIAAIDYIKQIAGDLQAIDWSSLFSFIPIEDDDIKAVTDLLTETVDHLKETGESIQSIAVNTFDQVVANVTKGLEDVFGGLEFIAQCPQQSVTALIAGLEELESAFFAAENGFLALRDVLSPDSLISSFPSLNEDFLDSMSGGNSTESQYFSEAITLYHNVTSYVSKAEADAHMYLTKFKTYYGGVGKAQKIMMTVFNTVFGPKFDVRFPAKIAAAADGTPKASGVQWSNASGLAYEGVQVEGTFLAPIVCPLGGVFSIVDRTTFKISITETTLKSYDMFFTGISPNTTMQDGQKVRKGQIFGTVTGPSGIIGLSLVKKTDKTKFLDPGQYLKRRSPSIIKAFAPTANSYSLTAVGFTIAPPTSLLDIGSFKSSSSSSIKKLARRDFAATQVCTVDEFETPASPICGGGALPEQRKSIQLWKTTEFFLVGGLIPVSFSLEFDAIIGLSAGMKICLLDLAVDPIITPEFAIVMSGTLSLGIDGLLSAGLTAKGTVADTHVPIAGHFPLAKVPAGVCVNVGMNIVPLTLTLLIKVEVLLIKYSAPLVTSSSDAISFEILNTCPAPGLTGKAGFLLDMTPPVFSAIDAYQVIGQAVDSPMVFARFVASDVESGLKSVTVSVGRSPGDGSITPPRVVPLGQGESVTVVTPTDASLDEQTIYVSFLATNQQNLTTTSSVALLYDLSPPKIEITDDYSDVSTHRHPLTGDEPRSALRLSLAAYTLDLATQSGRASLSAFADHLCFSFSITDQTPQSLVQYAIGTGANTPNDTVPWTTVSNTQSRICEKGLNLTAETYYASVFARNTLGFTSLGMSKGTALDFSPPQPGEIFFGTVPGQTSNGTEITNVAFITFRGFADPESGSAWWRVAIGPSSADAAAIAADPARWTVFGQWTQEKAFFNPPDIIPAPIDPVDLPEGNHTVCVQAQNFVGLSTTTCRTGYIVDLSPPHGEGKITADGFTVTVSLSYKDNLSGVQHVWVALGDGEEPVYMDWQKFDLSTVTDISSVNFTVPDTLNGILAYGEILLMDYAGNVFRSATTNFVQLDLLPPAPGLVYIGEFWKDIPYIDGSRLCVSFDEGKSRQWSRIFCVDGTSVVDEQFVVANVRGWNLGRSLFSSASSSGTIVDMTPPEPFNATIVTSSGTDVTRDTAEVDISWDSTVDLQSGLVSYLVALGKYVNGSPQPTALMPFGMLNPANPLATIATIYGADIEDGDIIFATVQATNGAGKSQTTTTQNVRVSTGRPKLLQAYFESNATAGSVVYVPSASTVTVRWNWENAEIYTCSVVAKSNGVPAPTVVSTAQSLGCFITASPALLDGQVYTIVLSATTIAGVSEEVRKDFKVATKAPSFIDGGCGRDVANTGNLTASTFTRSARGWWDFDPGSAVIVGYSYAFGSAPGKTDLTGKLIQSQTSFAEFEPVIPLAINWTYFLSVSAFNEAGLSSDLIVLPVGTTIVAGAGAGIAAISNALPGVEASYQETSAMIAANFSGFKGSTGYLGAHYEWALGTLPGGHDVIEFTSRGLLTSATVFGAGTILYPVALGNHTYFVTVRAKFGGDSIQEVEATSRGTVVINRQPSAQFRSTGVAFLPGDHPTVVDCTGYDMAGTLSSLSMQVDSSAWSNSSLQEISEQFNVTTSRSLLCTIQPNENDGVALFTQCRATNILPDVVTSEDGPTIVFDSSAPVPPPGLKCDPPIVSPAGFFSCVWLDAVDAESGISSYTASVGITAGGAWWAAAAAEVVFVSVKAINGASLSSGAAVTTVLVDSSPPTVDAAKIRIVNPRAIIRGNETVETLPTADCQSSTISTVVDWTNVFQDLDSPVVLYNGVVESRITMEDGSQQSRIVRQLAPVGDASRNKTVDTLSFTEPAFINGVVIVTIEAVNAAGLTATAETNVSLVNTGPLPLLVQQRLSTSSSASSFAIGTNLLIANWVWSSPCPIKLYRVTVLEVETGAVKYGPAFTNLTAVSLTNLPLQPNQTYITTVDAWNSLGFISNSTGRSAGTSIIWAPARAGAVFQGPVSGVDQTTFINTTFLAASWEAFASSTCEVRGSEWGVGTDISTLSGQTSVLTFTPVGQNLAASYNLPDPVALFTEYYVTVRAIDCTGTMLYAFSGGFHMGIEVPPMAPVVYLGSPGSTSSSQQANDTVTVSWTGASSIWSPVDVFVSLGSRDSASGEMIMIRDFLQVPSTNNTHTFTGLTLQQFAAPENSTASSVTTQSRYALNVLVRDRSRQNTTASQFFVVDQTPGGRQIQTPIPTLQTRLQQTKQTFTTSHRRNCFRLRMLSAKVHVEYGPLCDSDITSERAWLADRPRSGVGKQITNGYQITSGKAAAWAHVFQNTPDYTAVTNAYPDNTHFDGIIHVDVQQQVALSLTGPAATMSISAGRFPGLTSCLTSAIATTTNIPFSCKVASAGQNGTATSAMDITPSVLGIQQDCSSISDSLSCINCFQCLLQTVLTGYNEAALTSTATTAGVLFDGTDPRIQDFVYSKKTPFAGITWFANVGHINFTTSVYEPDSAISSAIVNAAILGYEGSVEQKITAHFPLLWDDGKTIAFAATNFMARTGATTISMAGWQGVSFQAQKYNISLIVTAASGRTSTHSQTVQINSTPPVAGQVQFTNLVQSASTTSAQLRVDGFSDPESGLLSYWGKLSNSKNVAATDPTADSSWSLLSSLSTTTLSPQYVTLDLSQALAQGWTSIYYDIVVANHAYTVGAPNAGSLTYVTSLPLAIATQSPTASITAVTWTDLKSTLGLNGNASEVSVSWMANAIVAGVAYVDVNLTYVSWVGTSATKTTRVLGNVATGSAQFSIDSVAPGTTLKACVAASSNTVPAKTVSTCQLSAPITFAASFNGTACTKLSFQPTTFGVSVDWSTCAIPSSVQYVAAVVVNALQSYSIGSEIVPSSWSKWDFLNANALPGSYKACLIGYDAMNVTSAAFCSPPAILDYTPPVSGGKTQMLYAGGGFNPTAPVVSLSTSTTTSLVRWDAWSDPESSVNKVLLNLVDVTTSQAVASVNTSGSATAYLFTGLTLVVGDSYAVTVQAVNGVGQSSVKRQSAPMKILGLASSDGPSLSILNGLQAQGSSNYTFVPTPAGMNASIHAAWSGFSTHLAQLRAIYQVQLFTSGNAMVINAGVQNQQDYVINTPLAPGLYTLSVSLAEFDGPAQVVSNSNVLIAPARSFISPPSSMSTCLASFSKSSSVFLTAAWTAAADPYGLMVSQSVAFSNINNARELSGSGIVANNASMFSDTVIYEFGRPTALAQFAIQCAWSAKDAYGQVYTATFPGTGPSGGVVGAETAAIPIVLTLSTWSLVSVPSGSADRAFFTDITYTQNASFAIAFSSLPPLFVDGQAVSTLTYSIGSAASTSGTYDDLVPVTTVSLDSATRASSTYSVLLAGGYQKVIIFNPAEFQSFPSALTPVYACVNVTNIETGAITASCSTQIMYDVDPPTAGTVNIDGYISDSGVTYLTSGNDLLLSWAGFLKQGWPDASSTGVASFEWALGSYPGGADYYPATAVSGNQTSAIASGMTLSLPGSSVYATVTVYDFSGLSAQAISQQAVVALYPPVSTQGGILGITSSLNADGLTYDVTLNFGPFLDTISGLASTEWVLETAWGQGDVIPLTSTNTASYATATGVILFPGVPYICRLIATNNAGLVTVLSTDLSVGVPLAVDYLVNGLDPQSQRLYTTSLDSYTFSWSVRGTPARVLVAVGSSPGLHDVQAWTSISPVDTEYTAMFKSPVSDGFCVYGQLSVQDAVGTTHVIRSTPGLCVDVSTPITGTVAQGTHPFAHQRFTADTNVVTASWTGFYDPDSGISQYAWCIDVVATTGMGTCAVVDWTPTTLDTKIFAAPLTGGILADGGTYYLKVKATNGAGTSVVSSSPPWTVDKSAATGGKVLISYPSVDTSILKLSPIWNVGTGATQLHLDPSLIRVDWDGFGDKQSGVVSYQIGLYPTSGEISPTTNQVITVPGVCGITSIAADGTNLVLLVNGFDDANVDLDHYRVLVGLTPYGQDLQAQNVSPASFCTASPCTPTVLLNKALVSNTVVFVTVYVVNVAGLTSPPATSAGVPFYGSASGVIQSNTDFQWSISPPYPAISFSPSATVTLSGYGLANFFTREDQAVPFECAFTSGSSSLQVTGSLVAGQSQNIPTLNCPLPAALLSAVTDGGVFQLVVSAPDGTSSLPVNLIRREPVAVWTTDAKAGLAATTGSLARLSNSLHAISWSTAVNTIAFVTLYIGATPVARFPRDAGVALVATPGSVLGSTLAYKLCPSFTGLDDTSACAAVGTVSVRLGAPVLASGVDSGDETILETAVRLNPTGGALLNSAQYAASGQSLTADWTGSFAGASSKSLSSFAVFLSHDPGALEAGVVPTVVAGNVFSATLTTGASLELGATYYANVIVQDETGLQLTAWSTPFIADTTAPLSGNVYFGRPSQVEDTTWQSQGTYALVYWSNFVDPESGLAKFQIQICSDVTPCSNVGQDVGSAAQANVTLPAGSVFTAKVRALNGVGTWGEWVSSRTSLRVDSTGSPVFQYAYFAGNTSDVAPAGPSQASGLRLVWAAKAGSPIVEYKVMIGTTRGGPQIMPLSSVGSTTLMPLNVPFTHGETVYATIVAIANSGAKGGTYTGGLLIDLTPPVVNGSVVSMGGAPYLQSLPKTDTTGEVTVTADWTGAFSDPESGIIGFEFAVGTVGTPAQFTNQQYIPMGLGTTGVVTITVPDGTLLVVTVRATNAAWLVTTAMSNPTLVGKAPPLAFSVTLQNADPPVASVPGVTVASSIARFSFDGLGDTQSGLADVQILLSAADSLTPLLNTSIGVKNGLELCADPSWLQRALTLTATAINNFGLTSNATSLVFKLNSPVAI
ncbi:hypothetical protein HDU88_006656 [Geranomyces variabilis]|nr:hypothetical protein HDU88_006656 [Geranomyces variabilis]